MLNSSQPAKIITLFDIIAHIESGNWRYATRFEASMYARQHFDQTRLAIIADRNHCSRSTAQMIYCTSYGATQIMGFNLYSSVLNLKISAAEFLSDDAQQKLMFDAFIARANINFSPDLLASNAIKRSIFARAYNGPGNIDAYSELLCEALRFFGFTVVDAVSAVK